jgi:hypothetical protein
MSLTNTTKTQFKNREASYSTRASRRGGNLLGWEEDESLSDEARRVCLVLVAKQLQEQIRIFDKGSHERKLMGQKLAEVNGKINEIRPARKTPGIEPYVIDVLRDRLTRTEFDRIFKEARIRMEVSLSKPN